MAGELDAAAAGSYLSCASRDPGIGIPAVGNGVDP